MDIYDTLNVLDDNSLLKAYGSLFLAIFLIIYTLFYCVEYIFIIINNDSIMEIMFKYLQENFPTLMTLMIVL
jgi:hypothetical protein